MAFKKKSVRASQLVSPFGVGAVVEISGESFCCADVSRWPSAFCLPLAENNLEKILHKEIRRPPTESQHAAVPFSRFPRWLFCPSCRRLYHYTYTQDKSQDFDQPRCAANECKKVDLVPMRFVGVCLKGH